MPHSHRAPSARSVYTPAPMTKVRFGLVIPAEFPDQSGAHSLLEDASRAICRAEGHFESVWVVDHFQAGTVNRLEAFTLLTYLAARHPAFKFGHTVLCQSFRNPALVAKMGATLQLLTGGRFILGMGAGGDEEEYEAYGYPFPTAPERVEQLEEAITIIKALWSAPAVTFNGKHHRVNRAVCEPRPNPTPPLMVGAFRPRMLRLVAKHADCWNVSSSGPIRYARMAAEMERACLESGRGPATLTRSWVGGVACATTSLAAEQLGGSRFTQDDEDYSLVGTPAEVTSQMQTLIDLGVDYFMLDIAGFPQLDALELLITDVLPAVTG
jgi:alkanesulfonate monooxygenase SsuD/methylene tetrahydromethanopterin reductase-like flavin-dependent oxidoreductase (luciferase family)